MGGANRTGPDQSLTRPAPSGVVLDGGPCLRPDGREARGREPIPTEAGLSAQRVVSLLASSTEIVCALDCGDRLVGRSHECDHPAWVRRLPAVTEPKLEVSRPSGEIHASVQALVEQAVSVYRVDAAALARLAPDLILTQTQCEVCAVSLRDVEEAVRALLPSRPRLLALRPDALADLWRDMRAVAGALDVPERGVQLVTRLRTRLQSIAARAAGRPRPRVACIGWIEPLMVAGNWTPELIALAGADDALGRPGAHAGPLTLAQLAAADPDVVWVTPCGFDLARTRAELPALAARPEWRALRAVREGRAFAGDGNAFFNRPGPRVAETLECLAEAMHPDAFRFGHEGTGWMRLG